MKPEAAAHSRHRRPGVARILVAAACVLPAALPATASLETALAAATQRARRAAPELSVHVVTLPDGRSVFERQADSLRIIASNTKLLTTATALDRLGPGFFFETPVFVEGEIRDGVLQGRLAIRGSGDPNISGRDHDADVYAVFRRWARELKALGIREIAGDVILLHGLYDDRRVHPDWPRDQLARWYEAPVDALSFSDNCVLVRVIPGSRPGKPVAVRVLPDLDIFTIRNTAVTTSSPRRHKLAVDRRPGTNIIEVGGMLLARSRPIEVWVSVDDPPLYFGAAVVEAFASEGVAVRGHPVPAETMPEGAWWRVTEHRTDLMSALEVTNRRSQNFFAEALIKLLGARLCLEGSWRAGVRAVREFLEEAGVEPGYRLVDGSGMSRGNRFSARQLTRLLTYMFGHRHAREFVLTLPYSGLEDHYRWRTRLAEAPYGANVFAKTGSLRSVSTLSGYAKARSGRVYGFSILCNGVPSVADARRAQDDVVRALIDHG